jgi:hypothetical protein
MTASKRTFNNYVHKKRWWSREQRVVITYVK